MELLLGIFLLSAGFVVKCARIDDEIKLSGLRLHQGDMLLTEDQYQLLKTPIQERKAKDNKLFLWPDGIVPFRLDKSSERNRRLILSGIKMWTDSTCLQFPELTTATKSPHLIIRDVGGCYSTVGRSAWEKGQSISLGMGCESRGTVAHEIGHAIGLYHEQSRPDRDNYVVVLEKNIDVTEKYNFDIENDINDYGVPYDITSLMHYDIDTFSANGKSTIVTRDVFKTFDIGQRNRLSFADIKLVNLMYECDAKCENKEKCLNDGYRDKTCRCKCPFGFMGDRCEEDLKFESGPGSCKYNVTSPTTITTPNYPSQYPSESKCIWLVQAPPGKKIRVTFPTFDVEERQIKSNTCMWDYVEIRAEDMYNGEKYCSKELLNSSVTSKENYVVVLFRSTLSSKTGFEAKIEFVP